MIRQINDVDWQARVTDAGGDYTITTSVRRSPRTAELNEDVEPRGGGERGSRR